jgi:hypothetical protein
MRQSARQREFSWTESKQVRVTFANRLSVHLAGNALKNGLNSADKYKAKRFDLTQ